MCCRSRGQVIVGDQRLFPASAENQIRFRMNTTSSVAAVILWGFLMS